MLIRTVKIYIVILGMIFSSMIVCAEIKTPSGKDVLLSCQSVIASSATDVQEMLCRWYAMPCDCDKKETAAPRVCLPDDINEDKLIQLIVEQLSNDPALQSESAPLAVDLILEKTYPCID